MLPVRCSSNVSDRTSGPAQLDTIRADGALVARQDQEVVPIHRQDGRQLGWIVEQSAAKRHQPGRAAQHHFGAEVPLGQNLGGDDLPRLGAELIDVGRAAESISPDAAPPTAIGATSDGSARVTENSPV